MTLANIRWATPDEMEKLLITRLINSEQARALLKIECGALRAERDMLARRLAMTRPSAEVVLAEMKARQDEDGRADDASMIDVLQVAGGLS